MPIMTSRDHALTTMTERFPVVAERVQQVWGLRLPRHVAVFAALAASDGGALAEIDLSAWGIIDYFRAGAPVRGSTRGCTPASAAIRPNS
jgi:hypothetical protein